MNSEKPIRRRRAERLLRIDVLEPRLLLAGSPNQPPVATTDHYELAEDTILVADSAPTSRQVLLARDATWDYLDELTNGWESPIDDYPRDSAERAWHDTNFDTASSNPSVGTWKRAAAPFAQGDITAFTGQVVAPLQGTAETHTTDLFRAQFTLRAEQIGLERLWLAFLADDGGVLYLNGQEVARHRLPQGDITTRTLTDSFPQEILGTSSFATGGLLRAGANTLAYELHQNSLGTTDRGFQLELTATNLDRRGVLLNDTDVENQRLTATVVDPPQHGTVLLEANGKFTYTPEPDFSGIDSFTYVVSDDGPDPATSTPTSVTLTVHPVADSLIARDDEFTLREDEEFHSGPQATLIPLGAVWNYLVPTGGVDPAIADGDFNATWHLQGIADANYDGPVFASGQGLLGFGGIEFQNPPKTELPYPGLNFTSYFVHRFTFDGDPADVDDLLLDIIADDGAVIYLNGVEVGRLNVGAGTDSFTQLASGVGVENALTTISLDGVLVQGVNQLAVSVHSYSPASEDAGFDAQLRIVDSAGGVLINDSTEDQPLRATVVAGPAHGDLQLSPSGFFLYSPDEDFHGVDSFTYRATDAVGDVGLATVTLNVLSVNDPPVAVQRTYNAREDVPLRISHPAEAEPTLVIPTTATWLYNDRLTSTGMPVDYPIDLQHALADWNDPVFSTANSSVPWSSAAAPFAVGSIDGFGLPVTPLADNGVTTCLFRATFDLDDPLPESIARGQLSFVMEDGGAVYLNGEEYGRFNLPSGELTPQTNAPSATFEGFVSTELNLAGRLRPGTNTLAVEVHRAAESQASPLEFLRVSEIQYDPAEPSAAEVAAGFTSHEAFEFLEFVNTSRSASINLDNVRVTGGLGDDLDFPPVVIGPGERVVIVRNEAAFRARYGHGPVVVGEYTGGLHNDGEQLTIRDGGAILQQFTYHDNETPGWYPETDDGFSLVIVDPAAPLSAWSEPAQWRPSTAVGGSPGVADPGESTALIGEDAGFALSLTLQRFGGVLQGASDIESAAVTARLHTQPLHGTVELAPDGTFTYTPERNFFGVDTFTFVSVDDDPTDPRESTPTTITILVAPDSPATTCEDIDWDRSGIIDRGDVAAFVGELSKTGEPSSGADYSGDGVVGVSDLAMLQASWGKLCSSAGTPQSPPTVTERQAAAVDAAVAKLSERSLRAETVATRRPRHAAEQKQGDRALHASRPKSMKAAATTVGGPRLYARRVPRELSL